MLKHTLIAVLCTAAVAPAAAQARPNDHRFATSSEAMKAQIAGNSGDYCYNAKAEYDVYSAGVQDDVDKGDYVASFQDVDHAAAVRTAAHNAGCGWAWT